MDTSDTPAQIDAWFRMLAEHHMPLARLWIPPAHDFALCDRYFRAAEWHEVKITATLGGEPSDANAQWIAAAVTRYYTSPALVSWILMNEPCEAPAATPLATTCFREWLQSSYGAIAALNAAWGASYADFAGICPPEAGPLFGGERRFIDWYTFWREHLTYKRAWIAAQIRKVDHNHPTHVNPHALISNLAANSQDLPAWRPFLDSLGGSCHPSWHMGLLRRNQYALGVAWINDLIRGASEPKPHLITELQGGNNLTSGVRPLNPTP